MNYVKALGVQELKPGEMRKIPTTDGDVLLANIDGTYYAVSGVCTHMGGSLTDGKLKGSVVTCPKHGAGFDVTTGVCVHDPHILFVKQKAANLKVYPVKTEQDAVWVGIE